MGTRPTWYVISRVDKIGVLVCAETGEGAILATFGANVDGVTAIELRTEDAGHPHHGNGDCIPFWCHLNSKSGRRLTDAVSRQILAGLRIVRT